MHNVVDAVFQACRVISWGVLLALGLSAPVAAADLNPALLHLAPNRWVKLDAAPVKDWSRQSHAGMAYDSKRGRLLIFGSNTHGLDWDNTVHEFDPVAARWVTHYPAAPRASYRADDKGRAVAGEERPLPWATHTYGGVTYDPQRDGLIITARPEHNPIGKTIPGARVHPSWFYSLVHREWQMLPDSDQAPPKFFGAAVSYDESRGVPVAYRWGVWELMPQSGSANRAGTAWVKVSKENHHQLHYSMAYNSHDHNFAVFGDYRNSNDVWIYTPGPRAGDEGRWEKRSPGGDACPRSQHFPVAFDRDQGVFLLVPGNTEFELLPNGRERAKAAKSNSTFIYAPNANRYTRVSDADMPALGMNFMMAYDLRHKVFLLVTGGPAEAPTVWALKLDVARLKR